MSINTVKRSDGVQKQVGLGAGLGLKKIKVRGIVLKYYIFGDISFLLADLMVAAESGDKKEASDEFLRVRDEFMNLFEAVD